MILIVYYRYIFLTRFLQHLFNMSTELALLFIPIHILMYKGGSFHSFPYVSYSSHRFGVSPPFTAPFPLFTVFPPLFPKFLPLFTVFFLPFIIFPPPFTVFSSSVHSIFISIHRYTPLFAEIPLQFIVFLPPFTVFLPQFVVVIPPFIVLPLPLITFLTH